MDRRLIHDTPVPRDAGVTLIELLVVVAVLAVLVVGVSLTAIRGAAPAAEADMAWFRTQFDTQQSLAIEGRATRGLKLTNDGLAFARRTGSAWEISPASRAWSGKVSIANLSPRPSAGPQDVPDVVFLPNGQNSSFEVVFSDRNTSSRRCRSDGWTGLICDGS